MPTSKSFGAQSVLRAAEASESAGGTREFRIAAASASASSISRLPGHFQQSTVWQVGGLMILACAGVFYAYADGPLQPAEQLPKTENPQDAAPVYRTETLSGKVVWLADALERQFGIKTVPEAKERSLALETDDGHVLPIVEDLRGRSFRTDSRLREMQVELRVRRYRRSPLIQVIRIYEVVKGAKYAIDYWCDVCAITMFEKGPCSCCQDENRLRRRRLDRQGEPAEEE